MNIVDVVFPKTCVGCGKWGRYVCEKCEIGMVEEEQVCPGCGLVGSYGATHDVCALREGLEGLTCFWQNEGIVKKLILEAKEKFYFDQLRDLTGISLGLVGREEFGAFRGFLETKPVVAVVPLTKKQEKERGFNQAKIIGQVIAKILGLQIKDGLLCVKDMRKEDIRNKKKGWVGKDKAFEVKEGIKGTILLVDDVWVTGVTMKTCCKSLKKMGAQKVWGLVLAR